MCYLFAIFAYQQINLSLCACVEVHDMSNIMKMCFCFALSACVLVSGDKQILC